MHIKETVIEQKQCIKCEQYLDLSNFYLAQSKNSYQSRCKFCYKQQRNSNYAIRSLDHCKEQWTMNVLRHSRKRAIQKSLPHNLTKQWIIDNIPEYCPVFLIPISFNFQVDKDYYPSLDRFNNNKGYTTDNVRIISFRANTLKSNATIEELEAIVRYMKNEL